MIDKGQDVDDEDPVLFTYVTGQQLLAELAERGDEPNQQGPGAAVRAAVGKRRLTPSWGQLVDAFARAIRLACFL